MRARASSKFSLDISWLCIPPGLVYLATPLVYLSLLQTSHGSKPISLCSCCCGGFLRHLVLILLFLFSSKLVLLFLLRFHLPLCLLLLFLLSLKLLLLQLLFLLFMARLVLAVFCC